ncbi:MAG: hypothetical protein COB02_06860 [Candidatus Cloacimonadota bacterium]|nr:MAG: hypothetical protein COB02_06860 [Candidatus Cloacimonadota bacterium]
MSSIDCYLIFPPGFHPGQPFLALPQLKSFLAENNFNAKVIDFNLDAFYYFLEPNRAKENLKKAISLLIDLQEKDHLFSHEKKQLSFLNYALQFGQTFLDQLKSSVDCFNNESFYQQEKFLSSKKIIHFFYRLACLSHGDSIFSFEVYYPHGGVSNPKTILQNISSKNKNLLYHFLEEQIKNIDFNIKTIGINATTRGQFHSALTLAFLLKKHNYQGKIVLGGSYITRLYPKRNFLLNSFMDIVDYFSFFEGEHNLLSLLKGKVKSSTCLMSNKGIHQSNTPPVENHHFPDFTDLPLNDYFSPDLVLPFQIRRGCIYGKCIFCEHPVFMETENKNRKNPKVKSLVEALSNLKSKYKTSNIYFIDEMILPIEMDDICQTILKNNLKLNFIFYSYFSNALLKVGRIALWKKAGLKKMWMGLESFDKQVLKNMKKFRPNDSVEKCLTLFKKEKLPVHLFLLLGFPGESTKSLNNTLDKLLSFKDLLKNPFLSLDLFTYTVYINSEAYQQRKELKIETYPKGDLDIGIVDWKLENGLDNKQVQKFIKEAFKKVSIVYGDKNSTNLIDLQCLQDSTHLLYINYHL